MLMRHGANLEYVDHALRNALYWSVYNCCGEIAVFLLDSGARVKPWSWIADEALPASFIEDPVVHARVAQAREAPHSLFILARYKEKSHFVGPSFLCCYRTEQWKTNNKAHYSGMTRYIYIFAFLVKRHLSPCYLLSTLYVNHYFSS